MKTIKLLFTSLIGLTIAQISFAQDANYILNKVSSKLASLQSLKYHYKRELNYFKDNYFSKSESECYLEFNGKSISGFQFISKDVSQFFNGNEYFLLDHNKRTYELTPHPSQQMFTRLSYLYNAIPTLRNSLPGILSDDSIKKQAGDTSIGNKYFKLLKLSMKSKTIEYPTGLSSFSQPIEIYYTLIVDMATGMPLEVIQRNNINAKDFTRVTFTAIDTKPTRPKQSTWQFTSYLKDYKPKEKEASKRLIAVGDILDNWNLPEYSSQSTTHIFRSDSLKGKLVLLDFWIKNCGYCMESFAHLKTLQNNYGKQVQIVSINAFDPMSDVEFFYKREKPGYKMLYDGRTLAQKLGVESRGYPTVVITKNDKVIYAGNFENDAIEKVFKANL